VSAPAPDPLGRPRLALLGDVHANLPALRAVLTDVRAAGLDAGVVTGDLVMRGTQPEACVAEIRRLGWPAVLGNTDRRVARSQPDPGHHNAARVGSRAWTVLQMSAESRAYLAGLPLTLRLELGALSVAVMHGTPEDPRIAVEEDSPDDFLRELGAAVGADVIVSGHTHRPLARRLDGTLFVNPGSVGEGTPTERRPAWAVLEAGEDGAVVRFMRTAGVLTNLRKQD
jgi:putative phosphoesterase